VVRKTEINGTLVQFAWWALAAIVFTVVVAIRIRLLGIPLERDEGEYAYAGQLILQGIPPYKLAYNMKFPGTYAAYALIMSIFGQTIGAIHLGLLLVNAATIALIFLIGRRLMGSTAGVTAAASYAILSVSPSVLGLAAHATNFVILPVLAGTLLLLTGSGVTSSGSKQLKQFVRLFGSGLLFGVGILMKQPALFFVPFGAGYVVWTDLQRQLAAKKILLRILAFGIGLIAPLGTTCLILSHAGVLDKFWFWTIRYAAEYVTLVPPSQVAHVFLSNAIDVVQTGWPLWALAAIGAVAGFWDHRMRGSMTFLMGFLFFSALALCQGFYFRPHYFILILPAISLFAGAAITKLSQLLAGYMVVIRFASVLLLVACLSVPILRDKKIFFAASPIEACRTIYVGNPFVESVRIADYVREHTNPDDTIAVLGSEPEIYFYSQRHSATGYIYTYALMEPQKYAQQMQQEMMGEIDRARPKYLVSVVTFYSWLWRAASERSIFTWANEYTAQNYVADGFVNITPKESDYFFGDVPSSVETLKDYVLIYKRKL
jgi:4-amino-4-deoxy-L-arabinose transferase-like glycosyltransferase